MILEFIGLRNLIILGLLGSLYFVSGMKNYMDGMDFGRAFLPYYVFHLNDGGRMVSNAVDSLGDQISNGWEMLTSYVVAQVTQGFQFMMSRFQPFYEEHPYLGLLFILITGFLATLVAFTGSIYFVKLLLKLLPTTYSRQSSNKRKEKEEEVWSFDPRKKPTDEQLKKTMKNLEKLVHLAPALGGNVPDGADMNIKEIAKKNQGADFNYRCAIYVMGPIKGMKLDNSYEIPLALDQIKKISQIMGRASYYETLPLDMVILSSRKGTTKWEVNSTTSVINLGKSYPVRVIEQVMTKNRKYFIWDARAKKSSTGYGIQHSKIGDE